DPAILAARARLHSLAAELGLTAPTAQPEVSIEEGAFEPLISIVVPVFDDEPFVRAALESIQRQSYQNWECLVVDDASTDSSWDLVRTMADDDHRFRAFRNKRNRGVAAARNLALQEATGEYFAFLDGDDLMLKFSLEDRVTALRGYQGDPYVVGSYIGARFGAEESKVEDFPDRQPARLRRFVDFVIADGECPFSILAPLVASEKVRALGGFDEKMRSGAADWDLWYRMLRNGCVFVASPFLGAIYRQNGRGFTRRDPAAHTLVSSGLIRAANKPARRKILASPTPFPMPAAVSTYRSLLKIAERATRFAAMALVDGKPEAMHKTLSVVDRGTWPLLDRHLVVSDLVQTGAARALGLQPDQLKTEGDALSPYVGAITAAIRDASA
ncbi:MAG TPA: glycosyltransferase family A protein, partial [Acidimicrobiia bacterium]